jgi:PAS domain S-box-containing protein
MAIELRKTGISVVGDMPWGTHFCQFFETKEDLLDILIPYFKSGLQNNEFCMWIVADPLNEEEAKNALRQAVPEVDRHLAAGHIEIVPHNSLFHPSHQEPSSAGRIAIVPHTEWYLKEGVFDLKRVISGWNEKLAEALARGYDGMRVNGNEAWLTKENWDVFSQYEKKLNEMIANQRMIVLCSYPLATSGAAEIFDVADSHNFAIARRKGAWQVLETPELKQAKAEIKRLNDELEQRIVERTGELAAANAELLQEITERKRSEEALLASEARLQAATDAADIGLWDWDLVSGHIIWLGHHDKLFGFAPGEFDGTYASFEKRVHPEDLEELNRVVHRARIEGSEYAHEYRVIWPDGGIHWIAGHGRFVYIESGQPVRMYGAVIDITKRKQAEAATRSLLQISEKLNATLDIDALLDSLVIEAMKLIDTEIGWSGLRTEEGMVCHTHIARDLQVVPFKYSWPPGVGLPGWVLVHKVPYVMNDAQSDKLIIPEIRERFGVTTVIDTPILDAQGEVIGFFEVINKKNGAKFSKSDVEMLVAVSRIASIALQNAMSYGNLERAEKALRESQLHLQALSRRLLDVQEAERRQIARELHDEIGQSLTGIKLILEKTMREPSVAPALEPALGITNELIGRVRDLSLELRPAMLDDLGLLPALKWHFERYTSRVNIRVDFKYAGLEGRRFQPEIETAAYRIVQEALTNVARHARVERAEVNIRADETMLRIEVRDAGIGFHSGSVSTGNTGGLSGMRERATMLGGELTVDSAPGTGTVLTAELPL